MLKLALVPSLALALALALTANAAPSPVSVRSASASSTYGAYTADKAVDGVITDQSRWLSQKSPSSWLELHLVSTQKLAGIHLYSGFENTNPIQDFQVQFWQQGRWQHIPSAQVQNNAATALAIPFDDTIDVTTDKLRLNILATHQDIARVLEVVVWPASGGNIPPLASAPHKIYLNQSGFNTGKPKRFTAPTLPDGSQFQIRSVDGDQALFRGAISNHVGDFTGFDPVDQREFVVVASTNTSVPFRIGHWWLERVSYQNAINFMVDSRHYVGNERAVCQGSFGWRDDHHFGWELHTLVPQFLSNPSAYQRMPRQVIYEKPENPALWGKLQPYREDVPDVVKLIHWGADVIVTQGTTHELLKSQLAYFLYAWPWLKEFLPAQNYEAVRAFTFAHWDHATCDRTYPYDESAGHNLLLLKTNIGSTKGSLPPGFSVQPNLLLYEVAKREGRPDAQKYFNAAYQQTLWMIQHLDWNEPLVTKGQRMSEFITLTSLAHFLREYPDRAPLHLAAKINAWADVVIRRSANLWDFRKLDDGSRWTPMGDQPAMWNEPGNVAGLPAALLSVAPFLTNAAAAARLEQLAWSHFDNMFGRNPTGRHFSFDAPREIEGVEHGWFSFYPGGIGRLENARFVIDGSPKDPHYPYNPQKGNIGWTEGWVQFNTAFNASLAYLAYAETSLSLTRQADQLIVRLRAPINFDYTRPESATVHLSCPEGDSEWVTVTEESPNSQFLKGQISLQTSPSKPDDNRLCLMPGSLPKATYGHGFLARTAILSQ